MAACMQKMKQKCIDVSDNEWQGTCVHKIDLTKKLAL